MVSRPLDVEKRREVPVPPELRPVQKMPSKRRIEPGAACSSAKSMATSAVDVEDGSTKPAGAAGTQRLEQGRVSAA